MLVTVDITVKGDHDGTLVTVHEERWLSPSPNGPEENMTKVAAEIEEFCDRVRDKAVAAVTA